MTTHKDLDAYKQAIDLSIEIYHVISQFPKIETYGLADQMKRAAVPVPSNIAEGAGRQTVKEFIQFLFVASGSLSELKAQVTISERLGFIKDPEPLLIRMESMRKWGSWTVQAPKNQTHLNLIPDNILLITGIK